MKKPMAKSTHPKVLQPQLALQVAFAFQLPGEIFGGEFRGDAVIPPGIPAAIDTWS